MTRPTLLDISTEQGPARAIVHRAATPRGSLLLGHGAGGGSWGADLLALTGLTTDGWTVVLVEQPFRVAGKKIGPAPAALDRAYVEIEGALRRRRTVPGPWVLGGRSAGARVACRAAVRLAAAQDGPARARPRGPVVVGVLALAFPLHPPGRPGTSRAGEAQAVLDAGLALGVVQGARDPFGTPAQVRQALAPGADVHEAAGDHSFSRRPDDVLAAARSVLDHMVPLPTDGPGTGAGHSPGWHGGE